MRSSLIVMLAVMAVTESSCGNANTAFRSYSGPAKVQRGDGGQSVSNHGIEIWTSGAPDRPFQVIGTIRDERDKVFGGNPTHSAAIARLVRAHGGDAAIFRGAATKPIGVRPGGAGGVFGTPSFSDQPAKIIDGTWTELVVIRFVRNGEPGR